MKILLRLTPVLFIAIVLGSFVFFNTADFEKQSKYFLSFFFMLFVNYLYSEYIIWLMIKTQEIDDRTALDADAWGYAIYILSAIGYAHGFVANNAVFIVIGAYATYYGTTLFTQKSTRENKRITLARSESALKVYDKPEVKSLVEKSKVDKDTVAIHIGSRELMSVLIHDITKNKREIKEGELFAILGALAGFSCHMAPREDLIESGKLPEKEVFKVIKCENGSQYYYGDAPNYFLTESPSSVWNIISDVMQQMNDKRLLNISELMANISKTLGSDKFGVPRLPAQYSQMERPIQYLKEMWPTLLPVMDKYCTTPAQRPFLLALAIKELTAQSKHQVPPPTAVKIVMEYAAPMSKIGPECLS